jgi:integrase
MAKKKTLCRAASGGFVRNLGWKRTPVGFDQHKFHLGRDESKATLANLRLEQLWQEVGKRWERENQYALEPTDRPVWDNVTLAIAEAIRKGEPVAKVLLPPWLSALVPECSAIGDWLDQLQNDITVIKIELQNTVAEKHADEYLQKEGQRLMAMGRRMLHKKAGGETLHAALSEYAKWIETKYLDTERRVTQWGRTQGRQIAFLRKILPECPLAGLDVHRIEEMLDVLRLRPLGENGRSVSVAWTKNVIKQFRHFLSWLNRSQDFAWKRPSDLEIGLIRIPLTPNEKGRSARAVQVETYTRDELKTLWQYATPFQRLLMLISLNCGFGKSEVASLEMSDILLRQRHPREREVGYTGTSADNWVLRIRHKSRVYGEWKLWPETVKAIDWWLQRRTAIKVSSEVTTLLVTAKGNRFDTPTKGNNPNFQIPNGWFHLTERVRKEYPEFRRLSFNKLRKTAGNFIREKAGGEVAGVFLCHGTPVRTDIQLDMYTNRPFAKVFTAIDDVGEEMGQIWGTIGDPFPDTHKRKERRTSTSEPLGEIKV